MLPLVLGGIALAAVGYGLKEYCESEGCLWDDEVTIKPSNPSEEIFEKIERKKRTLNEMLQRRLKAALLSVAPKKREKLAVLNEVHYEHFASAHMPEDVALYAGQYAALIDDALRKAGVILQHLETLKEKKIAYKRLDKEEKQQVKEGVKLFNLGCEVLSLQLLEGEALNTEAIAPLKQFQTALHTLQTKKEQSWKKR